MIRRLGFALTLACTTALPAAAQTIIGQTTGLVGPFTSFDFNGLVNAPADDGKPVGNKMLSSGLSFVGAFAGVPSAFYGPFSDVALYNYGFDPTATSKDTIAVLFTNPTNAVAFRFATRAGLAGFAVWKNGSMVGQISTTFANDVLTSADTRWWGFEFGGNVTFDKLTIVGDKHAFGFDDLQVKPVINTVPEPGSIGLLAMGLLALGVNARRRRK